jgi:hypothetical protein
MPILVSEPPQIMWLWHDAQLYFLLIEWSDSGELSVRLRCRINPEEDRKVLMDMGITTEVVDTVFGDVRQLHTSVPAVTADQPFVLDWDLIDSPSTDSGSKGLQTDEPSRLLHHIVRCSDGTEIDIQYSELRLDDVGPEGLKEVL